MYLVLLLLCRELTLAVDRDDRARFRVFIIQTAESEFYAFIAYHCLVAKVKMSRIFVNHQDHANQNTAVLVTCLL